MLVFKHYTLLIPDCKRFILALAVDTRTDHSFDSLLLDSGDAEKRWLGTVDTNKKIFKVKRMPEGHLRRAASVITINGNVDSENRISFAFGIEYHMLLWNLLCLLFVSWISMAFGLIGVVIAICIWVLAASLALVDYNNSYNEFMQYFHDGTDIRDGTPGNTGKRYMK